MAAVPLALDPARLVLSRVCGRVVFDVGTDARLHEDVVRLADACHGVERATGAAVAADAHLAVLPVYDEVEVVVCGDVAGRLADATGFFRRLRRVYPGVPAILTLPGGAGWGDVKRLRSLVEPAGYSVRECYGCPAGGLLAVVR